jgi:hypothetical protein
MLLDVGDMSALLDPRSAPEHSLEHLPRPALVQLSSSPDVLWRSRAALTPVNIEFASPAPAMYCGTFSLTAGQGRWYSS